MSWLRRPQEAVLASLFVMRDGEEQYWGDFHFHGLPEVGKRIVIVDGEADGHRLRVSRVDHGRPTMAPFGKQIDAQASVYADWLWVLKTND